MHVAFDNIARAHFFDVTDERIKFGIGMNSVIPSLEKFQQPSCIGQLVAFALEILSKDGMKIVVYVRNT